MNIPNDYTGAEVYRGHVIAIKDGRYKGFRKGEPIIGFGPDETRANVRTSIDRYLDSKDFEEGEIIFDVDGNRYQVWKGYAVLLPSRENVRYPLTTALRATFSRENPKP